MTGTPIPVLSQKARTLHLAWTMFDPVDLVFRVLAVDWSGAYRAEVRADKKRTSELLATFAVTAVYDSVNDWTEFDLVLTDSGAVKGDAWWDLQADGGVTRLGGRVYVTPDVTV